MSDFLKNLNWPNLALLGALLGTGVALIALGQREIGIGIVAGAVGIVMPQLRLAKGD